ncbi:hypothetical protein HDU85_001247 [Gaertneriomyces sp. JEL0708]|nr:hypothetical protein HDU85_001247 [Gaertneriomyces sp. JEL0708]
MFGTALVRGGRLAAGPLVLSKGEEIGPFRDTRALCLSFLDALRKRWTFSKDVADKLRKLKRRFRSVEHNRNDNSCKGLFSPVLQHIDLNPRNIIINDGHLVAIIDWDGAEILPQILADWYPSWLLAEMDEDPDSGKALQEVYDRVLLDHGRIELVSKLRDRIDPLGSGDLLFDTWVLLLSLDCATTAEEAMSCIDRLMNNIV